MAELAPVLPPPLTLLTLRLTFRAETPLLLPRWKGALLRGGLGRALRHALCDSACTDISRCPRGETCPYRAIFAPEAEEGRSTLQGLRDAPRPYAVLPPLEPQTNYAPGDRLTFGLLLAGRARAYLPHVLFAFEALGAMGLGQSQGRATLDAVESYDPLNGQRQPLLMDGVLHNELLTVNGSQIAAVAATLPATLALHFRTPMRLKYEGQIVSTPECHVLVRAALRRVSQLCAFFGEAPWDIPFDAVIAQALTARTQECRTHWVEWSRTSGATGRHMTLGGFVGSAVYTGVPPAIRAILLAGSLLHIGKAVVFGHGAYTVQPGGPHF
jgi:hypothetical protein